VLGTRHLISWGGLLTSNKAELVLHFPPNLVLHFPPSDLPIIVVLHFPVITFTPIDFLWCALCRS